MWDGPKGKPPMYKSKSFSIRKMATTTGRRYGAKYAIFACIRLRGYLIRLRDFLRETDRSIPPAAPGFLTAIWHGKHYNVTHRTPCFSMHILFPPIFLFSENSFDMCLLDFSLKKKNSLTGCRTYCICSLVIQFDLCWSDMRSNRWQLGLRLGSNCGFPWCLY